MSTGIRLVMALGRESARKYSSAKQVYLLNGLWAIGTASPAIPPTGNYQIKSSRNIVDVIINALTFGIVSTRTIKIRVRADHPNLKRNSNRINRQNNSAPADTTKKR